MGLDISGIPKSLSAAGVVKLGEFWTQSYVTRDRTEELSFTLLLTTGPGSADRVRIGQRGSHFLPSTHATGIFESHFYYTTPTGLDYFFPCLLACFSLKLRLSLTHQPTNHPIPDLPTLHPKSLSIGLDWTVLE